MGTRFNLLHGPTDTFLRFLCEVVHPVVRSDRNETLKLVRKFNDQLRREGWHLVEEEKIGGRSRSERATIDAAYWGFFIIPHYDLSGVYVTSENGGFWTSQKKLLLSVDVTF
jgi:hypothetical protein